MNPYIISSLQETFSGDTDSRFGACGFNTGNLVFLYAINKILGGNIPSTPWYNPVAKGDVGVIPLANQFFQYGDKGDLVSPFKKLATPLVGIGLGTQAKLDKNIPIVPEETVSWVKTIGESSPWDTPNISVRGQFSYKVLCHYGLGEYCEVIGCPSLFISKEKRLGKKISSRKINKKMRVAVAAGHEDWQELKHIENSLANIVTQTNGGYFMQSSLNMVKLAQYEFDSIDPWRFLRCKNYILPEATDEEFKNWIKKYAKVFFDIRSWFNWIKEFDFVVGMRIHACMIGISLGIPSCCIVIDSRTQELCETMNIPYISCKELPDKFGLDCILDKYSFSHFQFDKNRSLLARKFQNFLVNNRLTPEPYLKEIGHYHPHFWNIFF